MVSVVKSKGRPSWQTQLSVPRDLALEAVASLPTGGSGGGAYQTTRRNNRAVTNWALSGGSADADMIPALDTVRRQSRDLIRNHPLAEGAIATNVTSVVGTGLKPKSTIDAEYLGLSEDEREKYERAIERVWKLWAESRECDIARRLNFYQMQALVLRSTLENGDMAILRRFRETPAMPLGLRLQLIEGDRMATPHDKLFNQHICAGVEVDENGAPEAYYFRNQHPGDLRYTADSLRFTRVPAFAPSGMPWVLHIVDAKRVGQTRGMPYLAPVIEQLKQLSRYTDSELMAAVLNSMFTVIVTSDGAQGFRRPGDEDDVDDGADDDKLELGRGAFVDMAPGEQVNFADPKRPNENFEGFVVALCRMIGPALELPFEILVKHFTSSYSASRGALLEAWRYFRRRRRWLVEMMGDPAYEWVVAEAAARGIIDLPGFFDDPLARKAWLGNEWYGDAIGQLDPLKESKAAGELLKNHLTTHSRQSAEITGQDWERVHPQLVRERREIERLNGPESDGEGASGEDDDQGRDDTAMDGVRAMSSDGTLLIYRRGIGWTPEEEEDEAA